MNKFFGHLKTILTHKWYVFKYCCEAWIHHRGRNLHHYEAWTDNYDSGNPIAHMMPWNYLFEMIADYIAAGITYAKGAGRKFTFESEYYWWVNGKKDTCLMHEETKKVVSQIFTFLKNQERTKKLNNIFTWKFIKEGPIKDRYVAKFKECYNY